MRPVRRPPPPYSAPLSTLAAVLALAGASACTPGGSKSDEQAAPEQWDPAVVPKGTSKDDPSKDDPSKDAADDGPGGAPPPTSGTGGEEGQAPPAPVAPAKPNGPWQLVGQADPDFVASSIEPGQQRYGKWKALRTLNIGKSHLAHAMFSADEAAIIAMSEKEARIRVYDAASGDFLASHAVPGFVPDRFARGDVAPWPDPETPAFLVGNTTGLHLYDLASGKQIADFGASPVWDLYWSPDGRYLAATTAAIPQQTSRVVFYERDGLELRERNAFSTNDRVDHLVFSRDNRLAVVTNYPMGAVQVYDLATGALKLSVEAPEYTGGVAISPDNALIAAGGAEVWLMDAGSTDAATQRRARYTRLGNNVHRVRFSPSGDALVATSYDGHARVFSTEGLDTGKLELVADLRHRGSSNVYAARWNRAGTRLLTSSGDGTVRLWGDPSVMPPGGTTTQQAP